MLARQQALSRAIQIVLHKDSGLPEVEHDSDQIHQVLLNLLLNAIQAIDGQGKITVEVESRADSAAIIVADTGRGIPPEICPTFSGPFTPPRAMARDWDCRWPAAL